MWENDSGASDAEFARLAAGDWYDRGARLLGGCCRTTPATIECLATALYERHKCPSEEH
jgi:homocysteine S-methyltransferase